MRQDIDGKLLVPLLEFLLRPEVRSQGFNKDNITQHLTASAILLVYSPTSSLTKVRICVDPARSNRSGLTVNDSFSAVLSHIPDITKCLIICNFTEEILQKRKIVSDFPAIYQHPVRKWLSGSGTRLFQVAKLINSQENVDIGSKNVTKDSIPLFIDQAVNINFADYATKFNLESDSPEHWNSLQRKLLEAKWLQQHPRYWYTEVVKESNRRVNAQSKGGVLQDYTGKGIPGADPRPVDISYIEFKNQIFPSAPNPPPDWMILEIIATKSRNKLLKTMFRVLGWTIFAAHKWIDRTRITRWKLKPENKCAHTIKFCNCVIKKFLPKQEKDRPFDVLYLLEMKK